jgi:signal peptide peptidase SppA
MGYALGDWATGYVYLSKVIERGAADPDVKGIVLLIDSGGGHVSGCFDVVDRIYVARKSKPIRAVADEFAYSAAYAIASAADTITVARTGGVGSIGVLRVHYDMSKALEKAGITVTFIQSGEHKTDEHPLKPLSDETRVRMQERSKEIYEIFVTTVSRNRGIDAQAVRDTEALTFSASEAVSNGLADSIGSLDDTIAAFAADLSNQQEDEEMSFTQEQLDAAVASATASAQTEGYASGVTEGATSERARISAIVASDEGKNRPTMALKMATGDKFASLDAATVVEMLADMPEEKAAVVAPKENVTGKNFEATMNASQDNDLGLPGEGESAEIPRHERALGLVKGPRTAA